MEEPSLIAHESYDPPAIVCLTEMDLTAGVAMLDLIHRFGFSIQAAVEWHLMDGVYEDAVA